MARPRLELQAILEEILSEYAADGKQHVWFQPPSSVYLTYPCILYSLSSKEILSANNGKYRTRNKYTLTLIDRDPESILQARIESLPYCAFDRVFSVDGLHHYTYTIYF